jgi:hypothetical protein
MQGYLNNLSPFLAGSCIFLFVAVFAQLCWPQSFRDKRLFKESSNASSSQNYCSDIKSLDNSEVLSYLVLVNLLFVQGRLMLILVLDCFLWYATNISHNIDTTTIFQLITWRKVRHAILHGLVFAQLLITYLSQWPKKHQLHLTA